MRRLVTQWNGRADADAVGYTLVRSFYRSMYDAWFGGLDTELRRLDPRASYRVSSPRVEAVMEVLAEKRAWVPPGSGDWQEFLLDRIDAAIAAAMKNDAQLQDARWGATNRAALAHPFVQFMPWLARWLAAPRDLLAGDVNMPRVQAPAFGASERMVVPPGHSRPAFSRCRGAKAAIRCRHSSRRSRVVGTWRGEPVFAGSLYSPLGVRTITLLRIDIGCPLLPS